MAQPHLVAACRVRRFKKSWESTTVSSEDLSIVAFRGLCWQVGNPPAEPVGRLSGAGQPSMAARRNGVGLPGLCHLADRSAALHPNPLRKGQEEVPLDLQYIFNPHMTPGRAVVRSTTARRRRHHCQMNLLRGQTNRLARPGCARSR